MLKIFIGFDSHEIVAYHTCVQSIIDTVTEPVAFIPLCQDNLKTIYYRERGETESTEFSMTRFLVPYLSDFKGHSIFIDCDVLLRADITDLEFGTWSRTPDKAVYVVKHDYTPRSDAKFLGQVQTKYEKKNWSSVMFFNNALCRKLQPYYVNAASGLDLHQFKWLDSDELIGELPVEWNHLVGEYRHNPDAKLVHFTQGTPCFDGYKIQPFSDEWYETMQKAMSSKQTISATIRREVFSDPALLGG